MSRHGFAARTLCALGLAIAGWAAVPAGALGAGSLDATCSPPSGGFAIFSYSYRVAQVFTAKHSGSLLTANATGVFRYAGDGDDVTMQILAVNGSGVPTSTVLASTTIPGGSIPTGSYTTLTGNFPLATAAYLDEGSQYALAIVTTDSQQNSWNMGGPDPCTDGGLFQDFGSGFSDSLTAGYDAGYSVYLGPPNDDFSNRQAVTGASAVVDGSNFGGTSQAGEPDHYTILNPPDDIDWPGDHSVWYRWLALGSGPTTIDTCVAEIDSILAVYTGSPIGSLTRITDGNNGCPTGYGSIVSFTAVAGTTYQIAVADAGGARVDGFTLNIAGPPNEKPKITQLKPRDGAAISDTTPLIAATVRDSATDLGKKDIQLSLDAVGIRNFSYDAATDRLTYQAPTLAPGSHTVEIQATDAQGKSATKTWTFTVS